LKDIQTSYGFIPAIFVDNSGMITSMKIHNSKMNDSKGCVYSSKYQGLFITIQEDDTIENTSCKNVEISNLNFSNIYIYGTGGLISKRGNITITNTTITEFNVNKPKYNDILPTGSPMLIKLGLQHYSLVNNLNFKNSYGSPIIFSRSLISQIINNTQEVS
jgi:hypothetical protein